MTGFCHYMLGTCLSDKSVITADAEEHNHRLFASSKMREYAHSTLRCVCSRRFN